MTETGCCRGHALIIEDDMIVSHAIKEQLLVAGFRSVARARTQRRALDLAGQHFPDLVVVGEHVDQWAGLDAARDLSLCGRAAVMMVSANPRSCLPNLPDDAVMEDICRIDRIGLVFDVAAESGSQPMQLARLGDAKNRPANRLFPRVLLDCIGSGADPDGAQIDAVARHIRDDVTQTQLSENTNLSADSSNWPKWCKLAEAALRGHPDQQGLGDGWMSPHQQLDARRHLEDRAKGLKPGLAKSRQMTVRTSRPIRS